MNSHVASIDDILELVLHLVWKRVWEEDILHQIIALKAKMGASPKQLRDGLSTLKGPLFSILARPRNHGERTRQVIEEELQYLQEALVGHTRGTQRRLEAQSFVDPRRGFRFNEDIERTIEAINIGIEQSAACLSLRSHSSAEEDLSVSSVTSKEYSLLEPWDPSMSLSGSHHRSIASVLDCKKNCQAQLQPSIAPPEQVSGQENGPTSWWIPSPSQERRMSHPRFNSQDDGVFEPRHHSLDISSLSGDTLAGSMTGNDGLPSLSGDTESLVVEKSSAVPDPMKHNGPDGSAHHNPATLGTQSLNSSLFEFPGSDDGPYTESTKNRNQMLSHSLISWIEDHQSSLSTGSDHLSHAELPAPSSTIISGR